MALSSFSDSGPPEPWGLNYYQSVVPPEEDDAYDHDPKLLKRRMIFFPNLKEFVTLTEEKVATFEFSDLQVNYTLCFSIFRKSWQKPKFCQTEFRFDVSQLIQVLILRTCV